MSLRVKIILLVGGMTFLAAALIGGVNAYQIHEAAVAKAIEKLRHEAHLTALSVRNAYEDIRNDALIMIHAPAVQGFIRARRNGGIDTLDASTEAHWQGRLNWFFTSMMETRPHYTRIRYIGLENRGREIVHIGRQPDGRITAAPLDDLRESVGEVYFQTAPLTKDIAEYTSVVFDRILGNAGLVSVPTVHGIIPVFGKGDDRFGLIVISVDYEKLLTRAVPHDDVSEDIYVVDSYGSYFQRRSRERTFSLQRNSSIPEGLLAGNLHFTDRTESSFHQSTSTSYHLKSFINPGESRQFISVFVSAPDSKVLHEAQALARNNIIIGLLIVLAATVAAGLWANWLVSPISRMTQQLKAFKEGSTKAFDLPSDKQDEIGKLGTAFHDLVAQLDLYTAELERSNHDLDQFAYAASHDLKSPLRTISNALRWLEEDLADKLTGEDRENLELLRNRVNRMQKLLDDLLEYARIGRKAGQQSNEIVDGNTLINDVLALLTPPKSFKVEVSNAFATITINRMPLHQVLYNLIGNAIKHHDRESGLIQIDVEEADAEFRIMVRDDGPGIPANFHADIFELFRTLKPRDQVEGSGMGLAMVRRHVEHRGGVITVTSDDGRGSAFFFTWPKDTPATASIKAA
jgi:signal transduction histidine kinase